MSIELSFKNSLFCYVLIATNCQYSLNTLGCFVYSMYVSCLYWDFWVRYVCQFLSCLFSLLFRLFDLVKRFVFRYLLLVVTMFLTKFFSLFFSLMLLFLGSLGGEYVAIFLAVLSSAQECSTSNFSSPYQYHVTQTSDEIEENQLQYSGYCFEVPPNS